MFGFLFVLGILGGVIFGQGIGIVWLLYVDCFGNEIFIIDCGNYGGWGIGRLYSYNEYEDDVGVICGELDGKLYLDGKIS